MTFTFGELIPEMNSNPRADLKAFQQSAWSGRIQQEVVYTVPIDKSHWQWLQSDRFWLQEIHSEVKHWIRDYDIAAKQGKVKTTRTRNHPQKGVITRDYHEPAIHFLDRRYAISCRLRWGYEDGPVKIQSLNSIGTLPQPGKLVVQKDALKELARLKKLIGKYGYDLQAE